MLIQFETHYYLEMAGHSVSISFECIHFPVCSMPPAPSSSWGVDTKCSTLLYSGSSSVQGYPVSSSSRPHEGTSLHLHTRISFHSQPRNLLHAHARPSFPVHPASLTVSSSHVSTSPSCASSASSSHVSSSTPSLDLS